MKITGSCQISAFLTNTGIDISLCLSGLPIILLLHVRCVKIKFSPQGFYLERGLLVEPIV